MSELESMNLVSDYMKSIEPIKTSITDSGGKVTKLLLHPDKLVLLSTDYLRLYIMDPWKPWDYNKVPQDRVMMMDYLFTVEEIIFLEYAPERFLEVLTTASVGHPAMYYIYIDGERVYQTLSGRSWTKARNEYLYERKVGNIKFKHLKTVDPEKKETSFLFDQRDLDVELMRAKVRAKREREGTA